MWHIDGGEGSSLGRRSEFGWWIGDHIDGCWVLKSGEAVSLKQDGIIDKVGKIILRLLDVKHWGIAGVKYDECIGTIE